MRRRSARSSGSSSRCLERLERFAASGDASRQRLAYRSVVNARAGAARARSRVFGAHPSSPMSGTNRTSAISSRLYSFSRNTRDADQFLHPRIAPNRNDQPAADLELLLQRFRNFRAAGGDDDAVIGRMFRPALGPIAVEDMHVVIAEIGQRRRGFFGELADALDGVNVAGNPGQDGRRITGSGADLEHLFAALERQRFDHERDDIRLRDCLTFLDRQRAIFDRQTREAARAGTSRAERFAWR